MFDIPLKGNKNQWLESRVNFWGFLFQKKPTETVVYPAIQPRKFLLQ